MLNMFVSTQHWRSASGQEELTRLSFVDRFRPLGVSPSAKGNFRMDLRSM